MNNEQTQKIYNSIAKIEKDTEINITNRFIYGEKGLKEINQIKIKNKYLGTMYLDINEEDRIKLLDSNENYVGYTCIWDLEKDLQHFIEKLTEIKDICELVDLGFCNNMIFGKSFDELKNIYKEYLNNNNYCENGFEETIKEYYNQIGNNYFLVDYDEL